MGNSTNRFGFSFNSGSSKNRPLNSASLCAEGMTFFFPLPLLLLLLPGVMGILLDGLQAEDEDAEELESSSE